MKYKWIILAFLVIIVIQLVPYGHDHSNPDVAAEPDWNSAQTRDLFFRTCADCHSNETVWPWYSNIAPVSWLIQSDVEDGRKHFNVSMWGAQKRNKGKDAVEEFRDGEMPPAIYLPLHSNARLSETEKQQFIEGLLATFGKEKEKN